MTAKSLALAAVAVAAFLGTTPATPTTSASVRPPTQALELVAEEHVLADCTRRTLKPGERVGLYQAFAENENVFVLLRIFEQDQAKRARLCAYTADLTFKRAT